MNEPSGEPRLVRLGRWVRHHRILTTLIMLAVMLSGVALGQEWLLALGSFTLWFALYPGLQGSWERKLPAHSPAATAKTLQPIPAPAKLDLMKPVGQYDEQILQVLQMKHQIEDAAGQIRDPRLRQSAMAAAGTLPELIDGIYQLARLANDTRQRLEDANSDKAATGQLESAPEKIAGETPRSLAPSERNEQSKTMADNKSVTARLRRWDAQIDHAVSLFDTLLYQVLGANAINNRALQNQGLEQWPNLLKRETELLRSALAHDFGQFLT